MALEIDEEQVFGLRRLRRERFDPGQVDLVLREHAQGVVKRTGIVRRAEHDGRLVVPRLARLLIADDREARLVVRRILDLGEENPQSIAHGACRLATAAAPGSRWASSAAVAVLETSFKSACGTFFDNQLRHCESACGLE